MYMEGKNFGKKIGGDIFQKIKKLFISETYELSSKKNMEKSRLLETCISSKKKIKKITSKYLISKS